MFIKLILLRWLQLKILTGKKYYNEYLYVDWLSEKFWAGHNKRVDTTEI